MDSLYPELPRKLDIIGHLEEFRKRVLISLVALAVTTTLAFIYCEQIFRIIRKPIAGLVPNLIYISPTEVFTSYVKISLLAGFIVAFPVMLYHIWAFISPAIDKKSQLRIKIWFMMVFLSFLTGIFFSYFIALPAALKFLTGFGNDIAVPQISIGRYISFFGALILIGGVVFELPVVICLLTDAGFVKTEFLRKKRPHAVLAIMIFAAVITPTQDIFNMLLFAVPMIALYEVGILIARLIEIHKK